MVENQSFMNLSSYCSKNYVTVVLSNSKIIFLVEKEDAAFRPLLY